MKKAFLFKRTGKSGTVVFVEGDGLDGLVPIKPVHFPKPVMKPVMEKVMENGKPKLDAEGNPVLQQKVVDGVPAFEQALDENKQPLFRDDMYTERTVILETYAAPEGSGTFCTAVDVTRVRTDAGKDEYVVICGRDRIPVEVIDFSTEDKPDYNYRKNCVRMRLIAG